MTIKEAIAEIRRKHTGYLSTLDDKYWLKTKRLPKTEQGYWYYCWSRDIYGSVLLETNDECWQFLHPIHPIHLEWTDEDERKWTEEREYRGLQR